MKQEKPLRLATWKKSHSGLLKKKQCSHIRLAASVIPPDIATIGLAEKRQRAQDSHKGLHKKPQRVQDSHKGLQVTFQPCEACMKKQQH